MVGQGHMKSNGLELLMQAAKAMAPLWPLWLLWGIWMLVLVTGRAFWRRATFGEWFVRRDAEPLLYWLNCLGLGLAALALTFLAHPGSWTKTVAAVRSTRFEHYTLICGDIELMPPVLIVWALWLLMLVTGRIPRRRPKWRGIFSSARENFDPFVRRDEEPFFYWLGIGMFGVWCFFATALMNPKLLFALVRGGS